MSRRPQLVLALGALAGLAAAGAALVAPPGGGEALPEGAIALVNGTALRTADYERAVSALESDRRNPVGDGERRFVLERLVDEELLVQRALALGLARSDRMVRNQLVSAMIDAVVADAAQREPEEAEVRAFYEANRDFFATPGRAHVRQLRVGGAPQRSGDEARARASEAARRLRAGEPFEAVAAGLGDAVVAGVPDAPLPAAKLAEYVGPSAAQAAAALAPGGVSEPIAFAGGFEVLLLVAREPGGVPPLAEIASEVRAEVRRRAGDEALRQYLDELRQRAEIHMAQRAGAADRSAASTP